MQQLGTSRYACASQRATSARFLVSPPQPTQAVSLAPVAALDMQHGGALMPARSQGNTLLLEPSVSPAVCARLLQGKADQVRVPANWREVHAVFWQHPTTLIAVSSLVWLVTSRLQTPVSLLDGVALAAGAGMWVVQEWFIHAHLFHSTADWLGKRIHEHHHAQPYHHITLDGPEITGPFIAAAIALFIVLLGKQLGSSCAWGYVALGLFYQFTHYAVHTRALPQSQFWRMRRQHHMQHHCRNENFWLAFTFPGMDRWMGTDPASKDVPMTAMARGAVRGRDSAVHAQR